MNPHRKRIIRYISKKKKRAAVHVDFLVVGLVEKDLGSEPDRIVYDPLPCGAGLGQVGGRFGCMQMHARHIALLHST
jgi:hypothetical protein